jgi:5-methylcytosine-specific restriction endonuclease McrA
MKRTPINRQSKKKRQQLKDEQPIRKQLMERCKGVCEECGSTGFPFGIHPHEKIFRSHLGELSLDNSLMLCQVCHSRKHGIVVK